jgi:hypothetical protein
VRWHAAGAGVALEPLQIATQLGCGLAAQLAVFLQAFVDDLFELGGNVGIQAYGGNWVTFEDRIEDDRGTLSAEGQCAGRHLIEHRAEGKQIAAGIKFLRPGLLWRHVSYGAEGCAGTGQMLLVHRQGRRVRCRFGAERSERGRHLRESEVENLGVSALGDKNVCRLDVAMNDALGVGGVEGVDDLDGQREKNLHLQRTSGDAVLQRHAGEELHGDEGMAILFSNVVNGADIGVVQGRCGLRFALKAGEGLGIAGNVIGQELEGYEAMQASVFGFVDNTHATAAQLFDDAVVRDGLTDHWFSRSVESRPSARPY